MGAGSSTYNLKRIINDEFNRLRKHGRDFLVLSDLLKVRVPASHWTLNLSHLGTIFVINRARDGRITLADLNAFLDLAYDRARVTHPSEFPWHMQGYCTLQILRAIHARRSAVVDWLLAALSEALPPATLAAYPGRRFVSREGLQPLYEILDLKDTQGLAFDDLWDLLQRAAEEQGELDLEDPSLDDLVPIGAVRGFLDQLMDSMLRTIQNIIPLQDMG